MAPKLRRTLLMLCDETNADTSSEWVDFFAYGGLIVDLERAWRLTAKIDEIRHDHGFEKTDLLKFQSNSRPSHISRGSWNKAKSRVLKATAKAGCALVVVFVHHNIAKDPDNRHKWQMDALVRNFDERCRLNKAAGMVLIDRVDGQIDEYRWMQDRFADGLTWKDSGYNESLNRIMLYGTSPIGASHLASALDVALGSLAYCVNQRNEEQTVPPKLMRRVEKLFIGGRDDDGKFNPLGKSLLLTPQTPTHYRHDYQVLLEHIEKLSKDIDIPDKSPPFYL